MTLSSFGVINRKCSVTMLNKCLVVSRFMNHTLKLNVLPATTCIRQYAMTYDEEEREKKVKDKVLKVNLIMPDQKVSSMTLEQAQRLAKRRDLVMTKLFDPPKFASYAGRDVYEMVTKSQHVKLSEDSVELSKEGGVQAFKEKKTVTFSATIAEHDMKIKLKQIKKWLSKHHIVLVIIGDNGTGNNLKERVTFVETECKDVSKISIVSKKRQSLLTLVPHSNPATNSDAAEHQNNPTSPNIEKKSDKEPTTVEQST